MGLNKENMIKLTPPTIILVFKHLVLALTLRFEITKEGKKSNVHLLNNSRRSKIEACANITLNEKHNTNFEKLSIFTMNVEQKYSC